jgi:hypothetical protein
MHIERDSKRSITSQYRPFFHRFIEANRMYEVNQSASFPVPEEPLWRGTHIASLSNRP